MKRQLRKRRIYLADALRYAIVLVSVFTYLIALLDYFVLKPHFKAWQQLVAQYFAPIAVFGGIAVAMSVVLAVTAWRDPRIHWDEHE
jgi:hypothetical protein